ncbi:MAG: SIR2 family protein [Sulfuricurvum sp.]|jgi:hypothetical protein|uniref:SIR2 family protein n=1 Tax=Sulfuricurvum sp. TaxID=2025608 RepID=UPI0025E86B5C|nr:SIR2 family protein [Sulfuricurvum sp.]MCK9372167.1 SIR2 family protein [Sulfuricurvum sp.]
MDINEFILKYRNHPVLFIGTGISLRYLKQSYNWDDLLSYIAQALRNNDEYYLDLKSKCYINGKYDFAQIALLLENDFNVELEKDRNGSFKEVNDKFYAYMKEDKNISRFKIYISMILNSIEIKEEKLKEVEIFKKIRKNIGSIITTNYDEFIEKTFEFTPLIGNDILLSNPYGSVYKIHGCISNIENIIITGNDYHKFDKEYDLIRAQLLSLFIHNPIIFLGYSIEDTNIKKILKTIFSYINPKSELANKIKSNFLLIEYEENSENNIVSDYDINMDDTIIRINKLKTDNFELIYETLSDLNLPISAMDVKKVQNIVKEIYAGGDIKVSITEDLNSLKNSDKVLAIGSSKTIKYEYQTINEMIADYFKIISDENSQLLSLIDKQTVSKNQYFPIYGFYKINQKITRYSEFKENQDRNISNAVEKIAFSLHHDHKTIDEIINDENISISNKANSILWGIMNDNIDIKDAEIYLINAEDKTTSNYKKLLCAYDIKKYSQEF